MDAEAARMASARNLCSRRSPRCLLSMLDDLHSSIGFPPKWMLPSLLETSDSRWTVCIFHKRVPGLCHTSCLDADSEITSNVELDYKSKGHLPAEELLPEDPKEAGQPSFVPNAEGINQLVTMGFPLNRCEKALHATGNSDVQAAMEWLFSHMEDADIDAPLDLGVEAAAFDVATPEKIAQLVEMMGTSVPLSRRALKETGGNIERAVDWIFSHPDDQGDFVEGPTDGGAASLDSAPKQLPGKSDGPAIYELNSIICHKGSSVHSG